MTNPSRAKGTEFESAVAAYLGTERRARTGAKDKGDLVHRTWTLELKAPGRGKPLNLSKAMREAHIEAGNAGTDKFAAIVRRIGYPISEAYFVMPLYLACEVIPGLVSQRRNVPDSDKYIADMKAEILRRQT